MKVRVAIIAALVGVEFRFMFSSRRTSRLEPVPIAPPDTPNALPSLAYLFYTDPNIAVESSGESCFFSEDAN